MKRNTVFQIDLCTDTDGPLAYVYRWRKGCSHSKRRFYRCRDIDNPAVKARFINRVSKMQVLLCKATRP